LTKIGGETKLGYDEEGFRELRELYEEKLRNLEKWCSPEKWASCPEA
jgi:hypothetical protein